MYYSLYSVCVCVSNILALCVQMNALLEVVNNIKDAGNTFFKSQQYPIAVFKYKKSLMYLN